MLATQSNQYKKAMNLWSLYSKEYRTLIPTYKRLLEEKRQKKVKPLWKINKTDLEEYPAIDFLDLDDELEAENYLRELQDNKLANLIYEIDMFLDSHIRRTLKARICDYKHQLRFNESPKTPLAIDPNFKRRHGWFKRYPSKSASE